MNSRPKPVVLGTDTYVVDNYWNAMLDCDQPFGFALSPSQPLFIVATKQGFGVCENYVHNKTLLEVTAGALQPISAAFRPNHATEVILCFPAGQLLLVDAVMRSRGRTVWFNSSRILSTEGPPLLVRWLTEQRFAVLFADNTLWIYDSARTVEDQQLALLLKENLNEPTASHIAVAACEADANPVEAWKFFFGRITDLQVAKGGALLLVTTANGQLKVFDVARKSLCTIFFSYFAGFHCLEVDSHSQLVAAGGEDDSVSVWNLEGKVLVARCEGHKSWVTAIKFRDLQTMVTIGSDSCLLVWILDLHEATPSRELLIPYPSKAQTPVLRPVFQVSIGRSPLKVLGIQPQSILVGDEQGVFWMWRMKERRP